MPRCASIFSTLARHSSAPAVPPSPANRLVAARSVLSRRSLAGWLKGRALRRATGNAPCAWWVAASVSDTPPSGTTPAAERFFKPYGPACATATPPACRVVRSTTPATALAPYSMAPAPLRTESPPIRPAGISPISTRPSHGTASGAPSRNTKVCRSSLPRTRATVSPRELVRTETPGRPRSASATLRGCRSSKASPDRPTTGVVTRPGPEGAVTVIRASSGRRGSVVCAAAAGVASSSAASSRLTVSCPGRPGCGSHRSTVRPPGRAPARSSGRRSAPYPPSRQPG